MIIKDLKKILVLDFGGQYAHLITRRLRNMGYYSEIALPDIDIKKIKNTLGVILSGGPSSVYDKNVPKFNSKILKLGIPILGLCYGHQLMVKEYGGEVKNIGKGEYGLSILEKVSESPIFNLISFPTQIWMSHSDSVTSIPKNFELLASTKDCTYSALQNLNLKRFTLQFHPEVKDTIQGNIFLKNFINYCGMKVNWDTTKVLQNIKERIKKEANNRNVLLFLSGGVDSAVSYALLINSLGKEKVLGLYVDTGFMRKGETNLIKKRFKDAGFSNVMYENYEDLFLNVVDKIIDPQEKRRIIGETFLKVKDEIIRKLNFNKNEWILAQGTLYPDIIESGGTKYADLIKTHHNRVEGIKQLLEKGLVIEPLRDLYKDEVRDIGKKLGLPDELINRHPFPGPGISINLLCSNGKFNEYEKINLLEKKLKQIDISVFINKRNYALSIIPVKSVGVQGDVRTYNYTALISFKDFFKDFIGWNKFEDISSLITNGVRDINRVIVKIYEKRKCSIIEAYCTKERLDKIREVDYIVINEIKKHKKYNEIFQHLTISLPYASNKNRCSIVLRTVVSEDVMTARFAQLELSLIKKITKRIHKLDFVDALYYDITNKPPATFGWE